MPQSMQERAQRLSFDISQRGGTDKRQRLQSRQLRNLHGRLALSAVGMRSQARLFYGWNALTGVKKTREKSHATVQSNFSEMLIEQSDAQRAA